MSGRVVAELGRPETPEETAARKAQNSKNYRARQTVNNLIYSLIATIGIVVVIVLLVPRSDAPLERTVDVASAAAQNQPQFPAPLAVPSLPDGWRANAAEARRGADGVTAWYVGYLTPGNEYIGLWQGTQANPSWTAGLLAHTRATGTTTIAGIPWTIYDNRARPGDVGNARYGMVTEAGGSTFVLAGTADQAEFETLATRLAPTITQSGTVAPARKS